MPEIEPLITAAEKMGMLLIVRLHPLDRERLERRRVLPKFRECPEFGTFTLMAVADAVITDLFRAISIEASLIKKPVYFYVYDLERYKRGLNLIPLQRCRTAHSQKPSLWSTVSSTRPTITKSLPPSKIR